MQIFCVVSVDYIAVFVKRIVVRCIKRQQIVGRQERVVGVDSTIVAIGRCCCVAFGFLVAEVTAETD